MSKQTDVREEAPKISVIIPFLNNGHEVTAIVKKIREQSRELDVEIICVDNGSEEDPSWNAELPDRTIVITEHQALNSPYSARNRGIERAGGSLLVFVDANSAPAERWLENGLKCMEETQAGIIAGNVEFDFEGEPNAAKVVDAVTSIYQEKSVNERGAAFTANLFVKREVFEAAGLFEEGVRSGGDVRWTTKATKAGNSIGYCSGSVVFKKARSYRALVSKRMRTGRGYLYTWLKEENGNVWFYNFLRALKPPPPGKPAELYRERYNASLPVSAPAAWLVMYAMGIVEQLSFMAEYLRYNLGNARNENRQRKERF